MSRDYLAVDLSEVNEADSARHVYIKRIKETDVSPGNWTLPFTDGSTRQASGSQRRTPYESTDLLSFNREDAEAGNSQPENGDDSNDKHYWVMRGDVVTRFHKEPRTKLFDPSENDDPPLPLKYMDVIRLTYTDPELEI